MQEGGTKGSKNQAMYMCVCVCVVGAHENSSASGDRRKGRGGMVWRRKALSRGLVIENGATPIFDVEYRRNVSMRPDEPRRHASAGRSTVFRRSKIRLPRSNGPTEKGGGGRKIRFRLIFIAL